MSGSLEDVLGTQAINQNTDDSLRTSKVQWVGLALRRKQAGGKHVPQLP
jgi:hypothetical protein